MMVYYGQIKEVPVFCPIYIETILLYGIVGINDGCFF